MAASAFLVTLPTDKSGQTIKAGGNTFLCWAFDSADALELAADVQDGDINAPWADATATPIVAPASLVGWRFNIKVIDPDFDVDAMAEWDGVDPVPTDIVAEVTHTATAQTIDQVGDALVVLLNATAAIAGAAYNSGTNVLTIAETTDALGDHQVEIRVYPPAADVVKIVDHTEFYSTVVDEGAGGAALSAVLVAASPSKVYGAFKA